MSNTVAKKSSAPTTNLPNVLLLVKKFRDAHQKRLNSMIDALLTSGARLVQWNALGEREIAVSPKLLQKLGIDKNKFYSQQDGLWGWVTVTANLSDDQIAVSQELWEAANTRKAKP